MKKISLALLALSVTAVVAPAAMADTFDFTYNDGTFSATGTLSGNEIGSTGTYDVESGTINVLTDATGLITGAGVLEPNLDAPNCCYTYTNLPNTGGTYFSIDNLLTPGSSMQLDDNGIVFLVGSDPATEQAVAIWANGADQYTVFVGDWLYSPNVYGGGGPFFDATAGPTDFAIRATPEPSSLLLLGTGLIGLAFVAFRKAKSAAAQPAFSSAAF